MNNSFPSQMLTPFMLWADAAPALWQVADGPICLALFSTRENAARYAARMGIDPSTAEQLEAQPFVELLVECFRSEVRWAVLDPEDRYAKKLFDLADVLRRVREELRFGGTLNFDVGAN